MNAPNIVAMWIPRADEHELARSLGLVERPSEEMRAIVERAAAEFAITSPRSRVRVGRWHVWRVVRTLARLGETNSPKGRAAAFAQLAATEDDPT